MVQVLCFQSLSVHLVCSSKTNLHYKSCRQKIQFPSSVMTEIASTQLEAMDLRRSESRPALDATVVAKRNRSTGKEAKASNEIYGVGGTA